MRCEQSRPKNIWETLSSNTLRTEVPGGWLYLFIGGTGSSMAFVPYPPADTPVNSGWTVVG